MNRHLVPIKVRVKCSTDQRMQLNCFPLNQYRFKSLDTEAVKGRCTVEQNRMFFDHFFKDSPNPGIIFLQFALSVFNRVNFLVIDQSMENEGLE